MKPVQPNKQKHLTPTLLTGRFLRATPAGVLYIAGVAKLRLFEPLIAAL